MYLKNLIIFLLVTFCYNIKFSDEAKKIEETNNSQDYVIDINKLIEKLNNDVMYFSTTNNTTQLFEKLNDLVYNLIHVTPDNWIAVSDIEKNLTFLKEKKYLNIFKNVLLTYYRENLQIKHSELGLLLQSTYEADPTSIVNESD
ncbi:uncharacterized protein LOC126899268 isoform X1 [Daktulosphaira vitifoliae]|uniref:uncharacterized protein LOC126899268 isoform X1 n=1 Tax=Daktulosphaira vitifoliae TaxID=58002 RepID=UPI0021A9DA1E|nr:uncharacterized protein LOC126899268 isoform X1 [Daktulosphaira vitifoliae]